VNNQKQSLKELNPNMNPDQIKRALMGQIAQISKTLKRDSEDLRLSKNEHDKLASVIQAYDQTVADFMQSCESVEDGFKMKIQEVQTEMANLKKGKKVP